MSKTKILVIHLKEIIYTALFAGLGILLIVLLIIMFINKKDDNTSTVTEKLYTPGKWNTTLLINDTALNLEIVLDENHINSVRIVNIDEATTTMFPLVEPTLDEIEEQLCNGVAIDDIEINEDSKYTQKVLLDAIKVTLGKATPLATE